MKIVKSCTCNKPRCDYALLITVSRIGQSPEFTLEESCNEAQLSANRDQINNECQGFVDGILYKKIEEE